MYRYETHLHTYPVSRCATATPRETVEFYRELGYDGIFITNHFLGGNINVTPEMSYKEAVEFFFSDYEEAKKIGDEIGIKVFCGIELGYCGSDFLIYGPDKDWYLANEQIMQMKMSDRLKYIMESGALVIHAHPFAQASYIDHIRLFPDCVHGVEIYNASRSEKVNDRARQYADSYGLLHFASSDNHVAANKKTLGGMQCETPVESVRDFIERVKNGEMQVFRLQVEDT